MCVRSIFDDKVLCASRSLHWDVLDCIGVYWIALGCTICEFLTPFIQHVAYGSI